MFGFQTSCSSRVGDLKLCNYVLGNKLLYQFFDKSQRFKPLFPVLYVCYILVRINIPNKVCEILYAIISFFIWICDTLHYFVLFKLLWFCLKSVRDFLSSDKWSIYSLIKKVVKIFHTLFSFNYKFDMRRRPF